MSNLQTVDRALLLAEIHGARTQRRLDESLSLRQLAIFDFIRAYFAIHHYSPTRREIMKAVGLRSPSSVSYQLRELASLGLIELNGGKARAISTVETFAVTS